MNRIERRIAGTNGSRPGAPVCKPGSPQNNRGMLGSGSQLYQTVRERKENQRNITRINGLAVLQSQGDRISRLEQRLEQVEHNQALMMSKMEIKSGNNEARINLMQGDFKTTMKELRAHIKELQTKIKHLDGDIPILTAKKAIQKAQESAATINKVPLPPGILEKMEEVRQVQQANITLEINET
jgi:hypothetical protein